MNQKGYWDTPLTNTFYLNVGDGHQLYVELCGNPNGIPVVFLHGGPGGSINEKCRTFFNPDKYYIILFDQRGTGKSKPFLSLENNTPMASAEDMEALRKYLNINRWLVFGGSYGTTLALVYGIRYPERVMHLVLRGIFLGRKEDVDWLFIEGAGYFYPEEFECFRDFIPEEKRGDLLHAYYELMTHPSNEEIRREACKHWSDWENSILRLAENPISEEISAGDLSGGLFEAHYFVHDMFWGEDNYLLNHAAALHGIPMDIYHGRFDVDCRVKGAWELKKACPHANLHIVQTGCHYPYDAPLYDLLVDKMEELVSLYS